MTEFNSTPAVASCRIQFASEHKKAKRIIAAVDDYAHSPQGGYAVQNLLVCGSGDGMEGETFKAGAAQYVKERVFGSGLLSMVAWMALRWLVYAIIEHYIETLLMQEEK